MAYNRGFLGACIGQCWFLIIYRKSQQQLILTASLCCPLPFLYRDMTIEAYVELYAAEPNRIEPNRTEPYRPVQIGPSCIAPMNTMSAVYMTHNNR